MKAILIPIEDHGLMNSVLETALLVGHKFGSYLEGIALGPDIAEMVAADFSLSGVVLDDRTRRDYLALSRQKFQGFMIANKVSPPQEGSLKPSYGWFGEKLVSDNGIGEYGRVFDAILVGQPGSGAQQPRRSTLEAALFESGRPVIIAPPHPPATLGERIAIAWNGSTDTARTIAFALPFLVKAQDVIVLNVPAARFPGPSEEQVAKSLRRHGIRARVVPVPETSKASAGTALLETTASLYCDLLIKGGYTQSRLRQLIFGSVTSQILAEAQVPVFMAH
jgi:nucleotide-binding universal stress UspA family protein